MENTLEKIQSFLRTKFADQSIEVSPLGEGAWSKAYSFIYGDKKLVLRCSKFSEHFERDYLAATYSSPSLPIPLVTEIGQINDGWYAISEFADGVYFEKMTADELEKVTPSLLKMFTALHDVDLSKTTGFGYWNKDGKGSHGSWKEFLLDIKNDSPGRVVHGWRKNMEESEFGSSIFDRLYVQLETLVEHCPEERSLVHSDLLNFNVLAKDDAISAVLDWGSSMYGDLLYDLAWFLFYEPWYPEFTEIGLCQRLRQHCEATLKDSTYIDERLRAYQLHIALGSVVYNAYKKSWSGAREAVERVERMVE